MYCLKQPLPILKSDVNISAEALFKSVLSKAPMSEDEFHSIAHLFEYETIGKKQKLVTEGHNTDKAFFIQKDCCFLTRHWKMAKYKSSDSRRKISGSVT